jgi:hypothetical protein
MCVPWLQIRFLFNGFLNLRGEYNPKVVDVPHDKPEESIIVTLRHDPDGHPVEVKCYKFAPDLKPPIQHKLFGRVQDQMHMKR